MAIWFEIGLSATTVRGRQVIECVEVDGVRRRLLCLFPADDPDETQAAAKWAMRHEAYWQKTREPVRSVAEVVNTFKPFCAEEN